MLAWEPWDAGGGTTQPRYSLGEIIRGRHDGYIRRWARSMRKWGKPILLRFAHEMNGNWYPWAEGVNGNTAGQYRTAWRHVHDIFRAERATNVNWVWAPNRAYLGSTGLGSLYPGDAYVEWVGINGFNRGSETTPSSWLNFTSLFVPTLTHVRQLAPTKPIMIAETASTELGGDKAAWITDFFVQLKENPDVLAFVWFNYTKGPDFRIQSSPSAQGAFRAGIADQRFR